MRLVSGEHRGFGLNRTRRIVHVPHPAPEPAWTRRTLTCGVALQCSPSKDRIAEMELRDLSPRERATLTIVEGGVALGWLAVHWPGLLTEARRALPDLDSAETDLDGVEMLRCAEALARSRQRLATHPLLGQLPWSGPERGALASAALRAYGRMPWTTPRRDAKRLMSIPVGGEGVSRVGAQPPRRHTALLLDASSSLGVRGGRVFALALACADALSRAMTLARERHGIFVFTGNTRHRVDVRCLKDFGDTHFVDPSGVGLVAGGYTRLGAPLQHLTSRLCDQRSQRRLLIVIGDGLISDEG